LLVSMREDELALRKAIDSGDTDLVYLVLMHVHKTKSFRDFFNLIKDKPLACNLYVQFCKQKDLASLKQFYYHLQRPVEAANVAVMETYSEERWKERMKMLTIGLDFYAKYKQRDPNAAFACQALEEQIALLQHQAQFETEGTLSNIVDTSLSDVLQKCFETGQGKRALALQKQFQVSDKMLWHIEVRTLARCRSWEELYRLALSKKVPPIGFLPFVEACVEQKSSTEAYKYIQKLPEPTQQMEWLCNIGYWKEAAEIAAKEKDADALSVIRSRCKNDSVIRYIDEVLTRASGSVAS